MLSPTHPTHPTGVSSASASDEPYRVPPEGGLYSMESTYSGLTFTQGAHTYTSLENTDYRVYRVAENKSRIDTGLGPTEFTLVTIKNRQVHRGAPKVYKAKPLKSEGRFGDLARCALCQSQVQWNKLTPEQMISGLEAVRDLNYAEAHLKGIFPDALIYHWARKTVSTIFVDPLPSAETVAAADDPAPQSQRETSDDRAEGKQPASQAATATTTDDEWSVVDA